MAFAGGYGAQIQMDRVPHSPPFSTVAADRAAELLFSESNSRFVCEVPASCQAEFERLMAGVPHGCLGEVTELPRLVVSSGGTTLMDANLAWLKEAWQRPLRF
jgi:phosphoribosylformylglycinamidine synthase